MPMWYAMQTLGFTMPSDAYRANMHGFLLSFSLPGRMLPTRCLFQETECLLGFSMGASAVRPYNTKLVGCTTFQ
jgi:hypothetical protein